MVDEKVVCRGGDRGRDREGDREGEGEGGKNCMLFHRKGPRMSAFRASTVWIVFLRVRGGD